MEPKMNIPDKFLKPYNPAETEDRIYAMWEDSGFFHPETCIEKRVTAENAKPFTIMMPPPNVTGVLHMGHAMMLTIQDIMIRHKRMTGYRTLWLPGTDHAAIATQSKVEKEILKKEKKSRHDLGREELLKRVRDFAKESHDTIVSQIKVMGASCDWSREAFTLDNKRNLAVNTVFKKMYDDGLIYRRNKVINWDPKGQTTIADDEIVNVERDAVLYTFKYSHDFPIAISTTRPETKVGDTAVAVHPSDERYKEYIGKEYSFTFCDVPVTVKIIADESVEKDFGTGALGVTPAHSMTDWEIAEKHNLSIKQVINEYAKMTVGTKELLGKKTTDAREVVVKWLREKDLMISEEKIKQNVPTAERTEGIIEPLPKLQWFVNVNKPIPSREGKTLKEIMREPLRNGKIKMVPEYFNKTYFNWIDNLRDWCISRQIWYGHRIPVWYKGEEIFVGEQPPKLVSENASADKNQINHDHSGGAFSDTNLGGTWTQDEDTLDTWFSSGMWTFSALGWPEQTEDLKIYHPTDVLETGYEIIFFWVARMVMMSGYAIGEIPFHTVYFNGTVRDGQGRKMSKSLGNGIDPLDIAKEFGADAGRMALVMGTAAGTDSKISVDKIKGYKHFANKLWNITRFILGYAPEDLVEKPEIVERDSVLLSKFEEVAKEITDELDKYNFHLAAEKIYHYLWSHFADIIIEESKEVFKSGSQTEMRSRAYTLFKILSESLKVLHPFMPFVTEEIWTTIHPNENPLLVQRWPIK